MHTQVDLPQMKSEAVKQRLQNPAAAAAGGDDQIITNRPQSEVLYIHPFGECVEEDGSYAYAFVFEPPSHTHTPCLQGVPASPMLDASCNPVVLVFWAIFRASWRIVFRKME
jgi:hypothetical protein